MKFPSLNELYNFAFTNRLTEVFNNLVEAPVKTFGQKLGSEKEKADKLKAMRQTHAPLVDPRTGKQVLDKHGNPMFTREKLGSPKDIKQITYKEVEPEKDMPRRQELSAVIKTMKQHMPHFKDPNKMPSTDPDEWRHEWFKDVAKATEIIRNNIKLSPTRVEKQKSSDPRQPEMTRIEKYIVNETVDQAARTFGQMMADLLADVIFYFQQKHPGADIASPGGQYFTSKHELNPIQVHTTAITGVKEALHDWAVDEFKRSASELSVDTNEKLDSKTADEVLRRIQQKGMWAAHSAAFVKKQKAQPQQKEPRKDVKPASEKEKEAMKSLAGTYLPDHKVSFGKMLNELSNLYNGFMPDSAWLILKEAENDIKGKVVGGLPKIGGGIASKKQKLSPEEQKAQDEYLKAWQEWNKGGKKGPAPTPPSHAKVSDLPKEVPSKEEPKLNAWEFLRQQTGKSQGREGKPVPNDVKPKFAGVAHNISTSVDKTAPGAQYKRSSITGPSDKVDPATGKPIPKLMTVQKKQVEEFLWNAFIQDWVDEDTQTQLTKNNNKLLPSFVAAYKRGDWFPYTPDMPKGRHTGEERKGQGRGAPMMYWDGFDGHWLLPEMWEEFKNNGYKPFKVPGANASEEERSKNEVIDGKEVSWHFNKMLNKWQSPEDIAKGKEGSKFQDVEIPKELEKPPARKGKSVGEAIWTNYINTDTGKKEKYAVWVWSGDKHGWVHVEEYSKLIKSGEIKPEDMGGGFKEKQQQTSSAFKQTQPASDALSALQDKMKKYLKK